MASDLREAVARALINSDGRLDCLFGDDPVFDVFALKQADAAIAAVLEHLSRTANNIADAAARDRDQEHHDLWRQRAYWIQDERREAGQSNG